MLSSYVCLAGLLTLLVLAAVTDLRERRIPNWLTGGVAALYPVYLMLSPSPVAWPSALALALLVGLLGLFLFARELIGGGDVKLIAAVTLWAGLDHVAAFALVTTLTGGILGLASLAFQRWSGLVLAHLAGAGLAPAGGRGEAARPGAGEPCAGEAAAPIRPAPATLPYAVAIAAGGVAVIVELIKL
ncbi:MAG TPA: prepilin peptidase [Geminicoccaceae bacterium]|nr:prepilin peptidase [Geminicoccaceae bacterium]